MVVLNVGLPSVSASYRATGSSSISYVKKANLFDAKARNMAKTDPKQTLDGSTNKHAIQCSLRPCVYTLFSHDTEKPTSKSQARKDQIEKPGKSRAFPVKNNESQDQNIHSARSLVSCFVDSNRATYASGDSEFGGGSLGVFSGGLDFVTIQTQTSVPKSTIMEWSEGITPYSIPRTEKVSDAAFLRESPRLSDINDCNTISSLHVSHVDTSSIQLMAITSHFLVIVAKPSPSEVYMTQHYDKSLSGLQTGDFQVISVFSFSFAKKRSTLLRKYMVKINGFHDGKEVPTSTTTTTTTGMKDGKDVITKSPLESTTKRNPIISVQVNWGFIFVSFQDGSLSFIPLPCQVSGMKGGRVMPSSEHPSRLLSHRDHHDHDQEDIKYFNIYNFSLKLMGQDIKPTCIYLSEDDMLYMSTSQSLPFYSQKTKNKFGTVLKCHLRPIMAKLRSLLSRNREGGMKNQPFSSTFITSFCQLATLVFLPEVRNPAVSKMFVSPLNGTIILLEGRKNLYTLSQTDQPLIYVSDFISSTDKRPPIGSLYPPYPDLNVVRDVFWDASGGHFYLVTNNFGPVLGSVVLVLP